MSTAVPSPGFDRPWPRHRPVFTMLALIGAVLVGSAAFAWQFKTRWTPLQRYYAEGNAVRGEWFGRLAAEWGLAGAVTDEQFHRLAEGQHPLTGEQLVRRRFATEYQEVVRHKVCKGTRKERRLKTPEVI